MKQNKEVEKWIRSIGNTEEKAVALCIWEFMDFDLKTAMEVFYFWKQGKIVLVFDRNNDKMLEIKKVSWKK